MIAKRGSTTTKTYAVSGKTLDEINKDMMKKGPPDPNEGRKYSGSCKGELVVAIGGSDFAFETTPDSSPLEVTAKLKAGTLTSNSVITMPKLASEKGLSPDAVKEWKRFISKVLVHEQGHADSYFDLAGTMADEFNELTATGTGKDERSAQMAAQKALIDKMSKTFGGSVLGDRIKADAAAYDAKNKHGATQGAVLDASIT